MAVGLTMASALYLAHFLSKEGAKVRVSLSIAHPDISAFGTDRLFAWKLLDEWVSPDAEGDDIALASLPQPLQAEIAASLNP